MIGGQLAGVGCSLAVIGARLAAVGCPVSALGLPVASAELGVSDLKFDLARLDTRLAVVGQGALHAGRWTCRHVSSGPLLITLDEFRPALLQRRSLSLMCGCVAMQGRAGVVALSRPELRRVLVGGRHRLVTGRGVAVAFDRSGHGPSMDAMHGYRCEGRASLSARCPALPHWTQTRRWAGTLPLAGEVLN